MCPYFHCKDNVAVGCRVAVSFTDAARCGSGMVIGHTLTLYKLLGFQRQLTLDTCLPNTNWGVSQHWSQGEKQRVLLLGQSLC